jgi:glycosyltransferase involved in cell wall biosynthesis
MVDRSLAGSLSSRRRVLVGVPGRLSERMSGPGIRAWSLARALSESFEVTAAVSDPPADRRDGVRLVPFTRPRLAREILAHDAVVSACVPPYLLPLAGVRPTLVVSDQYDPVDLEVATLPDSPATRRTVATNLALMDLHLRYADVVLCANARQKDRIHNQLENLGRAEQPPVIELPFGLGPPPPPPQHQPLRERFPQIRPGDTIVLWWGTAWRWLDPHTAVHALAGLAHTRPDIKLVFVAHTPNNNHQTMNITEQARDLARDLGLLDQTILFYDDWVPFDQRHEILADADIGLCLHGNTQEAHFSARGRYLDYLWTGLPCILAQGDETGTRFANHGFATLVPPNNPTSVQNAITHYTNHPTALTNAKTASTTLATQYRWETLTQPLTTTLQHPTPTPHTPKHTLHITNHITRYYTRRLHDKTWQHTQTPKALDPKTGSLTL